MVENGQLKYLLFLNRAKDTFKDPLILQAELLYYMEFYHESEEQLIKAGNFQALINIYIKYENWGKALELEERFTYDQRQTVYLNYSLVLY